MNEQEPAIPRPSLFRRTSVWSAIITVVISFVTFVYGVYSISAGAELTKDGVLSLAVTFALMWLGTVVTSLLLHSEGLQYISDISISIRASTDDRELKEAAKGLLATLQVQQQAFSDEWVLTKIKDLGRLTANATGPRRHSLAFAMSLVDNGLQQAKAVYTTAQRRDYPKEKETQRMQHLSQAVKDSQDQIEAATVDFEDYFMRFWDQSSPYYGRYLNDNRSAAERGVRITRYFVMEEDVFTNRQHPKRTRLESILKQHYAFPGEIRVVSIEELEYEHIKCAYMLCDNYLTSNSYDSDGNPGVVAVGDEAMIGELQNRFSLLRTLRDRSGELVRRSRKPR